jgi:histone H3/H4
MPSSKGLSAARGRLIVSKTAVKALKETKDSLRINAQREILENAKTIAKTGKTKTVTLEHVEAAKKLYRVC